MSLIAELKQRKIVQWAIAYAAAYATLRSRSNLDPDIGK